MDKLAAEGLDYFERAGDDGDKKYVAAIRAELDALRKDADRYRWLRGQSAPVWLKWSDDRYSEGLALGAMDAAVDASMKGANARIEPGRAP